MHIRLPSSVPVAASCAPFHKQPLLRPTHSRTFALIGLTFFIAGCTRQVELAYAPREELKEIPRKHQEQIAEALVSYFGTPRFPKFMELATEDKQPTDAKEPLL